MSTELLSQLHIEKADLFGFSNGGTTALEIAIHHPALVDTPINHFPVDNQGFGYTIVFIGNHAFKNERALSEAGLSKFLSPAGCSFILPIDTQRKFSGVL